MAIPRATLPAAPLLPALRAVARLWVLPFVLAILIWPAQGRAQEASWERAGLPGRKVRSIALASDPVALAGLTLGAHEAMPLWLQDARGWWQPTLDLPGAVLTVAALPEGGLLVGTGRDISERPGIYWIGGNPLSAKRLYDAQAIGALAVAPSRHGSGLFAAAAPYGDREAGSELLRHEAGSSSWDVVLRGTLYCGDMPSYFKEVVVSPADPNAVLAVEQCFGSGSRLTQLWHSADHGQTWQVVTRAESQHPLIGTVQIDPTEPAVFYLASLPQAGSVPAGIERSDDGGATWQRKGEAVAGLSGVRVLSVAPDHPRRLVAGTERGGVFLSDDRGENWQTLPGLEGLRIWALDLDPAGGMLYAATADGVWKIPLP